MSEGLVAGSVVAGQFRVLGQLSQGGMGTIYRVEQIATGAPRALKVMLPQLAADARARERFTQEAQVASRIESEHVVQVIAAGSEGGSLWLAMELLAGEDLATLLQRRGTLPPGEVLEIFRQLAHALAAAHRVGIVHRDLKPENVFIATARRSDASFTVKVLDFGIAKWLQETRPATNTTVVGSPLWMAPEQLETRSAIGPTSDLWPLGLLAFSLLTGRMYWRHGQPGQFSLPMLVHEVAAAPYVPASQRAAEMGAGALPQGFDAWLGRCLSRDPALRFQDVGALVEALAAVLQGQGFVAAAVPMGAALSGGTQALPPAAMASMQGAGAPPAGAHGTVVVPQMPTPLQGSIPHGSYPPGAVMIQGGSYQGGVSGPVPGALPGTPGWTYTPSGQGGPVSAQPARNSAVMGIGLGLLVLAVVGGALAFGRGPQCGDGQHASDGHCCGEGRDWSSAREACVASAGPTYAAAPPLPPPAPTAVLAGPPPMPPPPLPPPSAPAAAPPLPPRWAPPPASAPAPSPHACTGTWAGSLTENTGSVGSMTLLVSSSVGSCARWTEYWATTGTRCVYSLTRCTALPGGMLRGVGVSRTANCTSPVNATITCGAGRATFRETVGSVVDVGRLTRT